MYVLTGGHSSGVHRKFLHEDGGTRYEGELPDYDRSAFVPVEAATGTLVLLHAAIPHFRCVALCSLFCAWLVGV